MSSKKSNLKTVQGNSKTTRKNSKTSGSNSKSSSKTNKTVAKKSKYVRKNYESDNDDENSDEYTEYISDTESEQSGGEDDEELSGEEEEDADEEDQDVDEEDQDDVEQDDADVEEEVIDDEEVEDDDADAEIGNDEDRDDNDYSVESKVCHAKNLKKDIIALDDEDSTVYANLQWTKVPDEDRITGDIMTYYELVRILGTRGQMINLGAQPLIETDADVSPVQTAYLELLAGLTPFIIRRPLANKKYEEWKISELKIIHEITEEIVVPENFDKQAFLDMVRKTFPDKK